MQVSFAEFGRDALPLSGGAVLGTRRENRPYAKRGKGSRSKLYIILEVIGGLRPQIAHTFSANLRAGRKCISPASYGRGGKALSRKRKPRRRLTAGRTPAGDAYGIPGIMVSADVESPPPRMHHSFTLETNHGTGKH